MHTYVSELDVDDWLQHFLPGPDLPAGVRFGGVCTSLAKDETSEWTINTEIVRNVRQSLDHL